LSPRVNFLVAGVQKGGTTALHLYLAEDPAFAMCRVKEAHFFDDERQDWRAPDYAAYEALFPRRPDGPCGEATPIYLYWRPALERIAAYNPAMRLVLLLRDPVQRAWSHWRMEVARGAETRPFAWCIREGRARVAAAPEGQHRVFSYVERGFYAAQLERLLELFPPRQVLVLRSDALKADPGAALNRVRRFLDLPEGRAPSHRLAHVGPAMPPGLELRAEDADELRALYAPDDARLAALAGISFGRSGA
jgi:hypothetical protein